VTSHLRGSGRNPTHWKAHKNRLSNVITILSKNGHISWKSKIYLKNYPKNLKFCISNRFFKRIWIFQYKTIITFSSQFLRAFECAYLRPDFLRYEATKSSGNVPSRTQKKIRVLDSETQTFPFHKARQNCHVLPLTENFHFNLIHIRYLTKKSQNYSNSFIFTILNQEKVIIT
jgi:hypothetical protein